jgi:quercetin dioxygenase-like cupin family protein
MTSRLSVFVVAALMLVTGFVFGQGRSGRTGVRVIELPTAAQVGSSVDQLMLLDTSQLAVTTVLVPARDVHNAVPSQGHVTVQALSGTGEVLVDNNVEHIDPRHLVAFAPGVRFDIRATGDRDLVLLVHEVAPSGKRASAIR